MSSSSSSSSEIYLTILLSDISTQFNRYISIIILLFGTIGNFLNCLVLSQPSLKSNPCAFFFLISSIANIISIISGLSTRILAGWNLDVTMTDTLSCKFRAYIMFVSRTIAFWLIALATVDRWCSSCNQYQRRKMSSLRNAQKGSIIIIILCSLIYCQIFYCYDANLIDTPLQCYGKTVICRFITDITYAFITVICPILIMSIFGLMTISNIRQTYSVILSKKDVNNRNSRCRRTLTMTCAQRERWRRIDRYLRHVLFRQVILLTLLTLPQMIEKLYTTITVNTKKSSLHITIDTFVYNIVLLLSFAASGMPFYIYTLSGGSIFRTTFLKLLQSLYKKLKCQ
ncbi:unnamed protein product [Adineta steineri]|uniref:G-protein coupled receptors family 1 profile domain-containing protein n=1 Tax=Adineta steineri TaxID=433720 RepID=A0A813Q5D8_9BILA|nr:unnamed protein product [Adineta steineri]CAF0797748.1 unnamed protein product [Adineta steineri]